MRKRNFLLIAMICCSTVFQAQEISMFFPAFAGKTYELTIFQGSRSVKVQQGSIPQDGRFILKIPEQYAPYTGMCRWLLTNSKDGGGLDMSVPGKGFSVSCISSSPDSTNIVYEGHDPVNGLNELNGKQQHIIDKYQLMGTALKLYRSESPLYGAFQKELNDQKNQFDDFTRSLKNDNSLAARYLPIINITKGIPRHLSLDYKMVSGDIESFISGELDMDDLYTSGYWDVVLDTWVQIEVNIVMNGKQFVESFVSIGKRIPDPVKYADFAQSVTRSLTRYGKDSLMMAIAPVITGSGKIRDFSGPLSIYKNMLLGKTAPDLNLVNAGKKSFRVGGKDISRGYSKTLLLFYDSNCPLCKDFLKKAAEYYAFLKEKNIRVIAIAADVDEKTFTRTSGGFPWEDNYCDYKSWKGENFINYSVSATPTAFIIGKDGSVESRLGTFDEVLARLQ